MEESELLLTVAEISVAFAGFASLASIFGRRSGHDDARVDGGRLLNMLTISMLVTSLALLPFVPLLLELPSRWVWGLSGGFGIVTISLFGPAVLRRTAVMRQYPGFSSARSIFNYAVTVIALASLACCVLGVPSSKLFAAYFGALVALLAVSGSLFFSVIDSLVRPNPQ